MAVEDVVAKHQAAGLAGKEIAADQIRLGQAIRARLDGVFDLHAPLRTVAEQLLEQRLLMRRVDDQHFADPGQHQHAERVVDHRLVEYRQQLLADRLGDRIQAGAGTAGEDDALSGSDLVLAAVMPRLRRYVPGDSCHRARAAPSPGSRGTSRRCRQCPARSCAQASSQARPATCPHRSRSGGHGRADRRRR